MTYRKAVRAKPKRGAWVWEEKWILVLAVCLPALAYFAYLGSSPTHQTNGTLSGGTAAGAQIPAFYQSAEAAQPFPRTLAPALFKKNPTAERAYPIAKHNPGLLAQQPCYCWCSRDEGHRSLLDCYASRHAETCDVCLKEALLAGQMDQAGKTAAEIRTEIIRGKWQNAR